MEKNNLSKISSDTFKLAEDLILTRMGYGAMQLAGPGVFGQPTNREEALLVLKEVVASGITHIDTSDFYGPHITNKLIKEALYPYPKELHIVTKVGALRDDKGNWIPALAPDQIRQAVLDNIKNLGVDALDVVNLRVGGGADGHTAVPGSLAEPFRVLAQMQKEGLIKHLGVSNVNAEQVVEAQSIAPVVCVQNFYNIANRKDDTLIDSLAKQGIAYVPFFPLGGFTPLQSDTLSKVAARLHYTPMAVALAWLLQRSPNILLIPGTSSIEHLRENISAVDIKLPPDAIEELNSIAGGL